MTVILNIVCVCLCSGSLENLVKVTDLLQEGRKSAYTIYRPKFAYNFKGFSDPFEARAGEEKQKTRYIATI